MFLLPPPVDHWLKCQSIGGLSFVEHPPPPALYRAEPIDFIHYDWKNTLWEYSLLEQLEPGNSHST